MYVLGSANSASGSILSPHNILNSGKISSSFNKSPSGIYCVSENSSNYASISQLIRQSMKNLL